MRRKDSFILHEVAGQPLLLPVGRQVLDTNGLVTLNATGRFLWELLAEDRTIESLTEALEASFEVDSGRARADTESFLNEIDAMGLLER